MPAMGDPKLCSCTPGEIHGVPLDKITDVRTLQERITSLEGERNRLKEQTPQQDDRLRAMNENQFNTIQELRTELAAAKALVTQPEGSITLSWSEVEQLRQDVSDATTASIAWKNGRDYYQTRYEQLSNTMDKVVGERDVARSEVFALKDELKGVQSGDREWDLLVEDRDYFRRKATGLLDQLDDLPKWEEIATNRLGVIDALEADIRESNDYIRDREALIDNCRDLLREETHKGDELEARIRNQSDTIRKAQALSKSLHYVVTGHTDPLDSEF